MPRTTPLERTRNIGITGAHRRREDDHHRADPLLHRGQLQDRRGPRGHGHHGLDGAGAGARDHHHLRRHHLLLARPPHQHHRHPRARGLHRRGGALAAGPRRGGGGVRRGGRGRSPSPRRSGARPTSTTCPRIAFINKMDRVGADFLHSVETMHERLNARSAVPIQLPLGTEDHHEGVVDLVEMKAYRYVDETLGAEFEVVEVPADAARRRPSTGARSSSRRPRRPPTRRATTPSSRSTWRARSPPSPS